MPTPSPRGYRKADGRSSIAAAGSRQILLGPVTPATGRPGRYWLRATMDNLTRGAAINALEVAATVLGQTGTE